MSRLTLVLVTLLFFAVEIAEAQPPHPHYALVVQNDSGCTIDYNWLYRITDADTGVLLAESRIPVTILDKGDCLLPDRICSLAHVQINFEGKCAATGEALVPPPITVKYPTKDVVLRVPPPTPTPVQPTEPVGTLHRKPMQALGLGEHVSTPGEFIVLANDLIEVSYSYPSVMSPTIKLDIKTLSGDKPKVLSFTTCTSDPAYPGNHTAVALIAPLQRGESMIELMVDARRYVYPVKAFARLVGHKERMLIGPTEELHDK